jgi:hypothetical protein
LDMNAILKTTEWTELIGLGEGGGMWGEAGTKAPGPGGLANAC